MGYNEAFDIIVIALRLTFSLAFPLINEVLVVHNQRHWLHLFYIRHDVYFAMGTNFDPV